MTKWAAVFLLMFVLCGANGQTQAFAQTDSNYAETGNPFVVHILVPNAAGQPGQIDFSAWDSVVPEENILTQTDWTPDGPFFAKDLTLVFFDADTLLLPPLPIRLRGGGTATTNALELTVVSTPSPDDLVDMSDIKDIRREPALWTDYLPWALAIGGFVLLVVLASWLIGRAQKKHGIASRTVELPPHELALKKLEVLEQKQLWDKGLAKEYCADLTFILREYLEKRFNIPALESSSEEMIVHLQKTGFPENFRPELQEILTKTDLVKFAKATPPQAFHEEALSFARKIIEETKPIAHHQPTTHP